jgi:hypothetical protein
MTKEIKLISKKEFEEICRGLKADKEEILKHYKTGSEEETLLWMLLGCLTAFLSLSEQETPCFTANVNKDTYRQAIQMVLQKRKSEDFDEGKYIDMMLSVS